MKLKDIYLALLQGKIVMELIDFMSANYYKAEKGKLYISMFNDLEFEPDDDGFEYFKDKRVRNKCSVIEKGDL